jgi:transcriptional regulator with XRE-family HTH domain
MDSIIAAKIKARRKYLEMSAAQLAEKSRTPKSTLSEIENGVTTKPCVYTMKRIANALSCRIEDLI